MLKNIHIAIIALLIFAIACIFCAVSPGLSICISFLLTSGFVAFNLFNIQRTLFIKSICSVKTDEKIVFLTFDDGPQQGTTETILETLQASNIQACFFCIGERVEANPELVLKLYNAGHAIGVHTYSHKWQDTLSSILVYEHNLHNCSNTLEKITGKKPMLFRPPFAITNPNIASALKTLKLQSIGWNIRSFDTIIKDRNKLIDRITSRLKPGGIILMHDSLQITADILPELIQKIHEKGYKILSLQQNIDTKIYE